MQPAPARCSDVTSPRSEAAALASREAIIGGRRPASAQLCSLLLITLILGGQGERRWSLTKRLGWFR